MDMMSLQCFVALVDTERFTAAAELMFMSQPSFSRRIKELEAELGLLLVERSTRRIRITEAGKIVYRYACNILQEERRMRDELKIEDGKEKAVGYDLLSIPDAELDQRPFYISKRETARNNGSLLFGGRRCSRYRQWPDGGPLRSDDFSGA